MRKPSQVIAAAVVFMAQPAFAQSGAELAEQYNQEGKQLFSAKKYEEALVKFQAAVQQSPEGRFYFNVCYTYSFLGRYQEAIAACEQVDRNGADEKLKTKTEATLTQLREKVATAPATTPGTYPPPTQVGNPFGQPPKPENTGFKWSLGVDLGFVGNGGLGKKDGVEVFSTTGFHLRTFADFLLSEASGLGAQGYIGLTAFGPNPDFVTSQSSGDRITIVDLGVGLFLQRALGSNFLITPAAGVHFSAQQIDGLSQAFTAFGAHGEVALSYVFGGNQEHAISLTPSVNVYSAASGESDNAKPEFYLLDKASATYGVTVGYQYRFSTPFAQSPFITLEQ